jgi:class 3 adenylate cyclase/tetratricopeptide (TPR) repeat protein
MATCLHCGEANPDHARFCLACGAPLEEPAAPREMRKTVTIVFSDLIDSTPLGESLDVESYRRMLSRYFIEVSRVLEHHGGTVEKFIGDAVMAVFGIPVVHEDDALRAVRAVTELREALHELNEELRAEFGAELRVRTGINTGEVVAGDPSEGQAFATGDPVAVAQRLEAAASPGEILIGEPTYRLIRDAVLVEPLEPLSLKGKVEPVEAWRLLGVVTGAPAFARRLDSPLVGRERESALLQQAFRRAVDERACHLFTVLGPAGVGKSRLVNELLSTLGDEERSLIGRCVPYGEGITFWPLRDVIRQAALITPTLPPEEARGRLTELLAHEPEAELVVEHLAAAIGLAEGDPTSEEIFWAVRKFFETLAQERPIVAAFDDVQWAEPTFLDLLDHLGEWTRDAPMLLVCLSRPELLDERPTWGGGKLNATSILLEPLNDDHVDRLIENLLGGEVDEDVRRNLRRSGEGNPLFVEELLAMMVEAGLIRHGDGGWHTAGDVGGVRAPPTIQALLAARLDRLGPQERAVADRAAVIGRIFSREALAALAEGAELDDRLGELIRKDLIRPERADLSGEESYRFRHILIREAAYNGIPKDARATLHERLAAWLEQARPGRLREYEEILGYHLEQAHRYRAELAPADAHTRALGARAADLLASAGRRALARGDPHASVGLLTRATILLADDVAARSELAPDLGAALMEVGDLVQADAVLARAEAAAVVAGAKSLELRAHLQRCWLQLRAEPKVGAASVQETAEKAIETFEQLHDDVGLARAWSLLGGVYWFASRWGARAEALEQALVYARRAGDRRQESEILGSLPLSLSWGATPIPEALERGRELLAQAGDDRTSEAKILVVLAELEAGLGNFDEARNLYGRSKSILEELGLQLLLGVQTFAAGTIELLAGNAAAAEAELRWGLDTLGRIGAQVASSTVAALLGAAVYTQGRYKEAERMTALSEATAPDEDVAAHILFRGTRAKVVARRGEAEHAEQLAREAVGLAAETDALTVHGDALMNLAEVLRLVGKEDDAVSVAEEARRLYESKGNIVLSARAGAWLERHRLDRLADRR